MYKSLLVALGVSFVFGCSDGGDVVVIKTNEDSTGKLATDSTSGIDSTAQQPTDTTVRVIVNISEKQLLVLRYADTVKKYAIAVGTDKNPTPTGEFTIHQIDFNPDWTPPSGEWADDLTYKAPGEKGNPMGRARIIYQMPYTIHGTKELSSLGEAESHGSIRIANKNVIELAKLLMESAGNQKPESWYQQVLKDSTKMVQVTLNKRIPLRNIKP